MPTAPGPSPWVCRIAAGVGIAVGGVFITAAIFVFGFLIGSAMADMTAVTKPAGQWVLAILRTMGTGARGLLPMPAGRSADPPSRRRHLLRPSADTHMRFGGQCDWPPNCAATQPCPHFKTGERLMAAGEGASIAGNRRH